MRLVLISSRCAIAHSASDLTRSSGRASNAGLGRRAHLNRDERQPRALSFVAEDESLQAMTGIGDQLHEQTVDTVLENPPLVSKLVQEFIESGSVAT